MWTNVAVNKDALRILCCSTIIPHWAAQPLLQPQLDAALSYFVLFLLYY